MLETNVAIVEGQRMQANVFGDIKRALDDLVVHAFHWNPRDREGSKSWTTEIKRRLARLGHERNFEVCCNGLPKGRVRWPEWLYDLCWLEKDKGNPEIYRRMPLAVECEWAWRGKCFLEKVMPDFQKLVFSAADYRLMIWQGDGKDTLVRNARLMRAQIHAAKSNVSHYLLAGYDLTQKQFVWKL